jgi:predicted nucleic acid-binding protein
MRPGLTLDTGALIKLESRDRLMRARIERAITEGLTVTVPAVVLIEWWRGNPGQRAVVERLSVEATSARLAELAGEAIATMATMGATATPIDTAVMASAAQRGDMVYTTDVNALQQLQSCFKSVRVMRC